EGIRVNAVRPGLIHTGIHALGGEPGRVAGVALTARRARARTRSAADGVAAGGASGGPAGGPVGKRPPLVPLFVAGFLAMIALRTTGLVPEPVLRLAGDAQELLLAAALFGLGSAVHLPTMARTGGRIALLGLGSWVMVAGVSYAGVLVTR
ncbi:putative sulfate exporter family transporter, partial [Kitasatospora sp. NPDC001574]